MTEITTYEINRELRLVLYRHHGGVYRDANNVGYDFESHNNPMIFRYLKMSDTFLWSKDFVRTALVARDQLIEEGLIEDEWETEDGGPPDELREVMKT